MPVNLRSVDLNLLTVFDAVMQTGKMSEAAERLGMTQPAVSNAIARLRLTFKDELFIRSRYGMVPTPRAKALQEPIVEALSLIRGTFDDARSFDPHRSERNFKLAIGDYGELILLPALLGVFDQFGGKLSISTYPEVVRESLEMVKMGQLDFHFDFREPQDRQLKYSLLSEEEIVVIARRGHPRFSGQLSQQEYLEADHIVLRFASGKRTLLDEILNLKKPIARKVKAEVKQYIAVPSLVTQTDCIATVPKRMADHYALREQMVVHPFPFPIPRPKSYMIWNRVMENDPGHRWLKDLILSLAESSSVPIQRVSN